MVRSYSPQKMQKNGMQEEYDDLTYDVYVPYSAYKKAFDTCVGIGAIKDL